MSDDRSAGHDDAMPLAGEYVLGVLSAVERRDFERRLAQEPALRTEVEYWERRLGGLASDIEPVDPPPEIWAAIEAAVKAGTASTARAGGLWNSLAFWRWSAIGWATAAAASIAALVIIGRPPTPEAPLIAKLEISGGQAGFVAAIDPAHNSLTIVPASATNVSQRVLELWLIAPGEKPRSLGLIEPERPVHINVPPDLIRRAAADATLAVSLEPPGGSPTGLPTGPVIANGKLTNL